MIQINWDSIGVLHEKILGRYNQNDTIFIYAYVRDRNGNKDRIPHKSKVKNWRESLYHITEMRNIKTITIADRHQNTLLVIEIPGHTYENLPANTGDTTIIERFNDMTDPERQVWVNILATSIEHYLHQGD